MADWVTELSKLALVVEKTLPAEMKEGIDFGVFEAQLNARTAQFQCGQKVVGQKTSYLCRRKAGHEGECAG